MTNPSGSRRLRADDPPDGAEQVLVGARQLAELAQPRRASAPTAALAASNPSAGPVQ